MAVSTGNEYLWGFVHWAERNPFNSLNSVHWDEIKKMVASFNLTNVTDAGTGVATDPGLGAGDVYGVDQDIPGRTTANTDGVGLTWYDPSNVLADQSYYPEDHVFTAYPSGA